LQLRPKWISCFSARLYTVLQQQLRGYKKILKYHLIPEFGKLTLTEFRRKHARDWTIKFHELSAKRMRNILSVLRVALDAAVERELIESNPRIAFKVRKRSTGPSQDIDPFSSEERGAILAVLTGQNRNLVQFAFWTGLRTSELCGLDWADVDGVRGVVVVSRVLTQGMEEPEEGTKTVAGRREVKLLAPALEALRAQKAYTYLKNTEVFQNPNTGERWTGDKTIREGMWAPALRKAKVRYRKPYQTGTRSLRWHSWPERVPCGLPSRWDTRIGR
jgi:integrase